MKELIKYSFTVISCTIGCLAQAQQGQAFMQENLQEIGQANNYQMVYTYNNISSTTVGSPYLSDDWAAGSVKLEDDQVLKNLQLKLDLYQNELILKKTTSEIYFPKDRISSFDLTTDGSKLEFIKTQLDDEAVFLQVLVTNESLRLLKQRKVTFIPARNEGAYKSASPNDEYKESAKFYLRQNGELIKVPKAYGKFAKLFPDQKNTIKDYLIDNRIDLQKEADLIVTINYISDL
ncbi:hypothetical protein [Marinoscillum sp.]|uniref:hypothetical protein n=1 Tax=Marinoscillum sp. TaxID=2024838 RepID=UPI003BAB9A43